MRSQTGTARLLSESDYRADVTPLVGGKPLYRTINWQEFRSGRAA